MSGMLIIVSAPSGTGKTTVLQQTMRQVERLVFSVSHTTRQPRPGEQDRRDYFFISTQQFEEMIKNNGFLEWALVHDNYYGTALASLRAGLDAGFDIVLDIDVQGAEIVRQQSRLETIDIFIAPPDQAELEKRLRRRGTEDEQTILKRLANAVEEMNQCSKYEYLIVNDSVENAVTMLSGIIYAERARKRRSLDGTLLLPAGIR
ncbi:MAG: guanylate kinase [Desulfocapsaceae bacterium]